VTEHTLPTTGEDAAAPDGSSHHGFKTPESLRALLIRLHEAGPGAWRSNRETVAVDLLPIHPTLGALGVITDPHIHHSLNGDAGPVVCSCPFWPISRPTFPPV